MNSLSQIKSNYQKNGFIIVKNLFTNNEINMVLKESEKIKKIIQNKNQRYFHKTKDNKINTIHNIQKFFKGSYLSKLAKKKTLIKIVEKLLNSKSKLRNIEFFLKPKKTGMKAPYHQDNHYWNIINANALNVWIACSSASKKNGGLIYLNGSQNLGTIKHSTSFVPGSSQQISNDILKKLKFKKICPKISKGDCIIHHPEVIHGSEKNTSNIDRIGLVISYMSSSAKYDKIKIKQYNLSLKENLKKIYN